MNGVLKKKYEKLLKEGLTEQEALFEIEKLNQIRLEKVKQYQSSLSKSKQIKRAKVAAKARVGTKHSEHSKLKMREANMKYASENPDKIKAKNEKKKITFANKTEEEKRVSNEKRSASIKAWWAANKDSDKVKERNKKLSERNKGENNSMNKPGAREKSKLSHLGKKQSNETKIKRAKTREEKAARGESLGLKSKFYKVGDFMCQGSSEKKYIESLYKNNLPLPLKRGSFVETPFGVYHPDFEFKDYFVEVKSLYTYKIYSGEIPNIDGVINTDQKKKLEWTSINVKEVKIILV